MVADSHYHRLYRSLASKVGPWTSSTTAATSLSDLESQVYGDLLLTETRFKQDLWMIQMDIVQLGEKHRVKFFSGGEPRKS